MTDAEEEEVLEQMQQRHDAEMRELHQRKLEQDQRIQAMLDAIREEERKVAAALERKAVAATSRAAPGAAAPRGQPSR
jgi:hypothetical protein